MLLYRLKLTDILTKSYIFSLFMISRGAIGKIKLLIDIVNNVFSAEKVCSLSEYHCVGIVNQLM